MKYLKSIFLIILPFLPSLSCYGMVLIFRNGHIFWEVENVVFETSETNDCGILKVLRSAHLLFCAVSSGRLPCKQNWLKIMHFEKLYYVYISYIAYSDGGPGWPQIKKSQRNKET